MYSTSLGISKYTGGGHRLFSLSLGISKWTGGGFEDSHSPWGVQNGHLVDLRILTLFVGFKTDT